MANLFGGRDQRGMLQRLRENAAASGMTTGDFASRSRPQTGGGGLRGGGIGASGGGIADQIAKLDAERNQQLRRTRPGEVAFKSRTYDTQRSGLVDQMKLQGAEAESGLALGMRQQALGIEQERNDITKEDNWLKRLQDPSSLVSAPAVPLATVVGGAQPVSDEGAERLAKEDDPLKGRKHGGRITGPGTSKSDSIPAYLSDGEYVLPAETVDQLGADRLDGLVKRTTGKAPAGKPKHDGLRGYAQGGLAEMMRVNEERAARMGGMYGGGFQRTGPPQPGTINSVGDLWNTPEWAKRAAPSDAEIAARTSSGMITPKGAPREVSARDALLSQIPTEPSQDSLRRQPERHPVIQPPVASAGPTGTNEDLTGLRSAGRSVPGAPGVMRYDNPGQSSLYSNVGNTTEAQAPSYVGPDGAPVQRWEQTGQYRDAMMRNAAGNDPARQGMMALMAQRPAEVDPMKQVQLQSALIDLEDKRASAPQREVDRRTSSDAARFNLSSNWDAKHREMMADLGLPPEMQATFQQFIDMNKDDLVKEGDDIESLAGLRQFYARQLPAFLAMSAMSNAGVGSRSWSGLGEPAGAGSLAMRNVVDNDSWRLKDASLVPGALKSAFNIDPDRPSLERALWSFRNNKVLVGDDGTRYDASKVKKALQNHPLYGTHGQQALDLLKPRKKD